MQTQAMHSIACNEGIMFTPSTTFFPVLCLVPTAQHRLVRMVGGAGESITHMLLCCGTIK